MRWCLFPHAGGSRSFYRDLMAGADASALEYPGRGVRMMTPPLRSVSALADLAMSDFAPRPGERLGVLGHSFGGLVALEFVRRLSRVGAVADILVVSGCVPPWRPRRRRNLHLADDVALVEELRRLGGTPEEILSNGDILEFILPAYRADVQAFEEYDTAPGQGIPTRLVAVGGLDDRTAPRADLESWAQLDTAGFELQMFAGGHFYLTQNPAFRAWWAELRRQRAVMCNA